MMLIRHSVEDNQETYFSNKIDERERQKNVNDLHKNISTSYYTHN
jgi:hypothetical protein